jgi:hypothetical protein
MRGVYCSIKGISWSNKGRDSSKNYTNTRTVTWETGTKNPQIQGIKIKIQATSVQKVNVKMQEKSAKGLCFCCDEKFGLGHRCANR